MAILRRIFRSPHVSLRSLNSGTSINKSMSSRPRLVLLAPQVVESEAEVVGCSHGWVAVFNKRNNNLFLSDPLSHRNIELPPIHTLPDPEFNLDVEGQGSVSKVILSSSADDDDCRAMMTFGPANRLAFCLPGRSSEWTPIGDHFFSFDQDCLLKSIAKVHEDLVYCATRKVFTCITAAHLKLRDELYFQDIYPDLLIGYHTERFDWDIQDPQSPKLVRSEKLVLYGDDEYEDVRRWVDANREVLENECIQIPHLAYLEERDQLFMAVQFVRLMKEDAVSPLGFVPRCEVKGLNGVFPGNTFGFVVINMDDGQVMGDLSGMSLFLGINHSFVQISEEDQFNPNSIYFADSKRLKRVCGVHDYGIFDYATKTISSAVVCHDVFHHVSPTNTSSPFWLV